MKILIKTNKLTKELILKELTMMRVDHSIEITDELLDIKISILLEDCKDLTAEAFAENCRVLRKQEMYGKLPANFKFLQPAEKSEFKKYMEANGRK